MRGRRVLTTRIEEWLAAIVGTIVLTSCSVAKVTFTTSGEPGDGGVDGDLAAPAMVSVTIHRDGTAQGVVSAGSVPIVCRTDCMASVASGTTITLTATPEPGGRFSGWSGDGCAGLDATCTLTVIADIAVTARFDVAVFTVDVELIGNAAGSVTSTIGGVLCPGACTISVPYLTVLELVAHPALSATFGGWGGACTGTGTCSFAVTAATRVTATFTADNMLVVAPAGNGRGTVSSVPPGIVCGPSCTHGYAPGTVVILSAAAEASDSMFTGWSDPGCPGLGPCRVVMSQAVTVAPVFVLQKRLLTVGRSGAGTGTVSSTPAGIACGPDCEERYDAHTMVTLTASPDSDSTFIGWSGDGGCSGVERCGITMDQAAVVTAQFGVRIRGGLFAINDVTAHLERIDPVTLAATDVGPLGIDYALGDCAWDAADSTLYVVDGRGARALYRVNLASGAATLVGVHGLPDLFALGYHPLTNRLYGIASDNNLYTLSPATGAATLVGSTRHPNNGSFNGMVWDSRRNRLIALTSGGTAFFAIDVATGQATELAQPGFLDSLGLAYDPAGDRLWVADIRSNFFQFDPDSFTRVTVGTAPGKRSCLAFVPSTP